MWQEKLEKRQKKSRDEGIPGFEGFYEPDKFGRSYVFAMKQGGEE